MRGTLALQGGEEVSRLNLHIHQHKFYCIDIAYKHALLRELKK